MAIESMTGFARAAGTVGVHSWAWEVRSVNGKGLDIRVRVPPGFDAVAEAARKRLSAAFARGTLHVNLSVTSDAGPPRPRINEAVLASLLEAVARLPQQAGIAPPSVDGLLGVRGVIEFAEDVDEARDLIESEVLQGLDAMCESLKQARASEGRALEAVIRGQRETIAALAAEAESHPARSVEAVRERLSAQVRALLDTGVPLDQQRLHQEAALLAVKADIREEIDRLRTHVEALDALLAGGGAIGRKLDFLAQEFGREASTLCAKAGDAALSRIGIDLRGTVDQMREQVQNVE